ncbi:related to ubiquitin-specific proteinase UBP1 [Rhynchosporium agropyri]|uniref:ubiquitinyl hydrolase 1 n=1 Tax=Rhynchosporium agropyri TaxID=914238 RepID=A0A1E1KCA4_9HELO|nr:related to ubiquitin-specific proteinase UBP1 [Rhynchosporium agropyri]
MSPSDSLKDLFDGDPDLYEDYHQDFSQGIIKPSNWLGIVVALIIFGIPIVYQILSVLDYDVLPLLELLWNALVYITPSQLLDAVEYHQNPLRLTNPSLKNTRTHAEKSEVMRRVLGMDIPGGIIESVTQAGRRRLSILPGLNLTTQGDGRPAGLGNWDNSCYQNSVLQGLASLDSLPEYLTSSTVDDSVEVDDEDVDKPDMKMAEALRGLIATLKDPANNGRRIWTPATLKNMSSWQQQDAQEYFSKVLDEIDKEVGMIARSSRSSRGFESEGSSEPSSQSQEAPSLSSFRNPLEGLIAQRVGCMQCGYSEGLSMIPFNCLTVPLTRSWECNVSECLDEYTKLELIEGVECGKCTLLKYRRLLTLLIDKEKSSEPSEGALKKVVDRLTAIETALEEDDYEERTLANELTIPSKNRSSSTKSRQAVIARPPKSLVVHFNRSLFDEMTGELKKNLSHVRFPRVLDLGPWCLGSSGSTEDVMTEEWLLYPDKPMIASTRRTSRLHGPMYELRAVVTHYGRHENGHYVCYKKSYESEPEDASDSKEIQRKDQWWKLSDDEVTKASEDNVLGQGGVFMLFYDCIEPGTINTPEPEKPEVSHTTSLEEEVSITTPSSEITEDLILPDLNLAASTPLPDTDDDDLSESDDQKSICEDYQPAKAIMVTPYVHKAGNDSTKNGGQKLMSPDGSLVMV